MEKRENLFYNRIIEYKKLNNLQYFPILYYYKIILKKLKKLLKL